MALGVDGLVSGIDSTSLINNLIKLDSIPQTLLKQKSAGIKDLQSAFQTLNSQLAALTDKAKAAAQAGSFQKFTATGSSSAIAATASTGAQPGQLEMTVDRLAQGQVSVSEAMTGWTGGTTLTVVKGGTSTEITAASASLDDIVAAINASNAGVKALKVAAGTDGGGSPQYRIQYTSTTTGADSAFTIYDGDAAAVQAGTATDLLASATLTRVAQDAQVTLWAGTGAQQQVTSSSNTFTGLLPGVDVTVAQASAEPVSLTVSRDDAAVSAMTKGLVDSLNAVFDYIATNSAVSISTDASGNTVTTGGRFTGNSTISLVKDSVMNAATRPVDGRSPSEIGISITRDGTIEFDADTFASALAADPARVEAAVQALSQRVADAGAQASDKYDGLLTKILESQESQVKDLGQRIGDWDRVLADRRSSLERMYAALEVQLGQLNSQSSWLASQIAGLPKAAS